MISINEAVENGVRYIRSPKWASPQDYMELHITKDGQLGPWIKLWSPANEIVGKSNPQELLVINFDLDAYIYEIWQVSKPLIAPGNSLALKEIGNE